MTGFALVIVTLAGPSCAGFRGGELEETRSWPPRPPQDSRKPTVSLSLIGKADVSGKAFAVKPEMANTWYRHTREEYASSGLFADVLPPRAPADVQAEVEVMDQGTMSTFLTVLSGVTLTIIPCRGKDEFTWKTTFKDGTGAVRGVIEKREASILWIEFFLIFVLPFDPPATVFREVIRDLNRSTLQDALERGYLKP
ncbi:MAG TPA: hypothetical protein VEN81_11495 [Planctomycetota bacterium]|nr:hypothetical protein [Planctomycetota bacterium]